MDMKQDKQSSMNLSRRAFVAGSAAASFVALAPRTVFGFEANSRIKAGIIGLGGRGRMIASMVRDHGGFQVTAVADYFRHLAEGGGGQFSVPKEACFSGLSGYRGLVKSGVEAVFLETPPYCFPDHAEAAVEAGCHVYMAKPVACDVAGCNRILAAANGAASKGRNFMVDFQTRTEPINIEVIKKLHEGAAGPVGLLSSIYADESFPDPPKTANAESRLQGLVWVNDDDLGGGYLVNAGIHAVDVALWMAGAVPVSAVGRSRRARSAPNGDSHDVYSITYEFADGLVLNHRGEHLPNQHGFTCNCVAYGASGFAEGTYDGQARLLVKEGEGAAGEVKGLYERGAQKNIAAFEKQLRAGNCDNTTVAPSVNATLATILGREAGMRGERVTWDAMMQENRRLEPDLSGLTL